MTHHPQATCIDRILEVVAEEGLSGMTEAIRVLLNEVMKTGAGPPTHGGGIELPTRPTVREDPGDPFGRRRDVARSRHVAGPSGKHAQSGRHTRLEPGRGREDTMRMALVAVFALSVVAAADEPPAAEGEKPARLLGLLEPQKASAEDSEAFWIQVGPTRYALVLDGDAVAAAAAKLRGRFVEVQGKAEPTGEHAASVQVAGKDSIAAQERHAIKGQVHLSPAETREEFPYLLVAKEGAFFVAPADTHWFKDHIDGYVAAESYVVSDSSYRQLADVRSVEEALPPGARKAPRKGDEAMTGKWAGKLLAEKAPSGVPGVTAGDEFAVSFDASGKGLDKVTGRLMDTYDVTGVRVRKFSSRKGTVELDLEYTFGSGSYSVRFEGTFKEDWKEITGTWSSSFLGSGTFTLDWSPLKN